MAILDDILAVLKGANPTADDADLQAQAAQLASHPDAPAVMSSFSPSSFDVSSSGGTVTQNGRPDSLPSQMPPPAPLNGKDALPPLPTPVSTPPPATPSAPPALPPKPAVSAPVEPPAKPEAPSGPVLPPPSDDNATRQAHLDAANKQAKMAVIPAAIAGIGGAIGNAASVYGAKVPEGAEEAILNRAQENLKTNKAGIETGISNDPNSEASRSAREVVLQIAPQMAKQPGFNMMSDAEIRNKLPLIDTMMKAKAAVDAKQVGLEQAKANRDLSLGLREDQQQDRLEQNAIQHIATMRGDQSLARAEEQRDAAIVAYNRLNEVKQAGKGLNPVDYADVLGQVYKARTGRAPGEQVLKDIHQATAEGKLGKAYTFATGNQAPATSTDIMNSLMDMAHSMGTQADQFHENYMKAHLIKPSHLEESRWKPISETGRGISFADATKTKNAASTTGGTSRTSAGGHRYTVSGGQ